MPLGSRLARLGGFPFEVRYSHGFVLRARTAAKVSAAACTYFSRLFSGLEPDIALIVANESDWESRQPYGLPFFNDDEGQIRPGVVVIPARGGEIWIAMGEDIRRASPRGYRKLLAVYPDGGGGLDLQPFFDLVTVHELGHAFETFGSRRLPTAWLGEIFANLALHAFVATMRPESLKTLETLSIVGAGSRRLSARMRSEGYSTLEELEAHYAGGGRPMNPLNYVWYQYRWQRLAARVFEADGEGGLVRFWEFFHPNNRTGSGGGTAATLARVLETEVSRTLGQSVRGWR
jgi:hypothetical protein